jgi:hypothetical protein
MFLAITEKEMEVFGIQLPERCVLMSSASSVLKDGEEQMITAASQNPKTPKPLIINYPCFFDWATCF